MSKVITILIIIFAVLSGLVVLVAAIIYLTHIGHQEPVVQMGDSSAGKTEKTYNAEQPVISMTDSEAQVTGKMDVPDVVHFVEDIETKLHALKQQQWQRDTSENLIMETVGVVFIDSRPVSNLKAIIENTFRVLPTYQLQIIHFASNETFCQDVVNSLEEDLRQRILMTSSGKQNITYSETNPFFASEEFLDLVAFDVYLFIAGDAWLCDKSMMHLEDFLLYDYTAPPLGCKAGCSMCHLPNHTSYVGCSGLYLARVSALRTAYRQIPYAEYLSIPNVDHNPAFDLYVNHVVENKPTHTIAKRFGLGPYTYYARPFGVHQGIANDKDELDQLKCFCSGIVDSRALDRASVK
jgi:hypothetical protein